jgi:hypothetical protein
MFGHREDLLGAGGGVVTSPAASASAVDGVCGMRRWSTASSSIMENTVRMPSTVEAA